MTPFLHFSKALAERGHRISFISTPRNIQRLPKIPRHLSDLIHDVSLPLPHCDGLPADAESTMDIPPDKMQCLKKAFDGLEGPVAAFLERTAPDWIIYDLIACWVPRIAKRVSVGCVYFSIFPPPVHSFFGPPAGLIDGTNFAVPEQLTVPPPWIPFPTTIAFRQYEAAPMLEFARQDSSGVNDLKRFGLVFDGCQLCIIRGCNELHSSWLHLVEDLYKKPVLPVGLLPPSIPQGGIDGDDETWVGRDWLDKQARGSTVYVAFGSEVKLSKEQIHALALGLVNSKLPFIWAFRSRSDEPDMLPAGFEDRIDGQGVVVRGWVPQLKVLAHPSVGGFLTHGGWGSIVEGLALGKPLILLPIFYDQGLNAIDMAEKKVGLEVERNEEDGTFNGDAVAKALRSVMGEEDGRPYRRNADKMKEVFGNQELHNSYVDAVAGYLQEHKGHLELNQRSQI